jgi:hypothetical protein
LPRWRRALVVAVAGLLAALGAMIAGAQEASAAPRVDYTIEGGALNADGDTKVTLTGSGFQSIQGGFGGVYVLFGWVDDPTGGTWRPSAGGITGEDYRYAFDDETNPVGYQLFVSFPGSSTEYAANGGEIAADGTWSATIIVPGARFTSYDRQQNETAVDCLSQQCGIITIGAHGVKNPNNESFTPLSFTEVDASAPAATAEADDAQSGAVPAVLPQETSTAQPTAAPAETPQAQGLSLSSLLLLIGGILGGIAVIALAAGTGGYLAAKSLLLGVSPAAMQREIGRRQRRADKARHKQDMKRARLRRRAFRRLRKQRDRTAAEGLAAGAIVGSPSGHAPDPAAPVPGGGPEWVPGTGRAVTRRSLTRDRQALGVRNGPEAAGTPDIGDVDDAGLTQVLQPVGATDPAASAGDLRAFFEQGQDAGGAGHGKEQR